MAVLTGWQKKRQDKIDHIRITGFGLNLKLATKANSGHFFCLEWHSTTRAFIGGSVAEWSAWPSGQRGRVVSVAEWSAWPSGQRGRVVSVAEWSAWPNGQHGRVASVAEWSAWRSGQRVGLAIRRSRVRVPL